MVFSTAVIGTPLAQLYHRLLCSAISPTAPTATWFSDADATPADAAPNTVATATVKPLATASTGAPPLHATYSGVPSSAEI